MRLFILIILIGMVSCQQTKQPPQKKHFSKKPITAPVHQKGETYQVIKNNVARLHAMMNGKYVQYSVIGTTDSMQYQVWKVNDGQDSIMIYTFPVGDPKKVGYWSFSYQVLTSLPDEPTITRLEHFEAVDRDTIISTLYEVPDDLEMTLAELLEDAENIFEAIDFKKLKPYDYPGFTYIEAI